ncbi:MAG: hypothetical protein GXP55_11720 [Deltaproteobacteria bacterium]|nr:hypothetical protein [Deltaproteobacteria bacterium]
MVRPHGRVAHLILLLGVALAFSACRHVERQELPREAANDPPDFTVVSRTTEIPTYPCTERCHARREPNPTPRDLTAYHTRIVLRHGPNPHFCDFCHVLEHPETLHRIDGETFGFDEAYRLCGQCHGEKLRDWMSGIHGLQTGSWNGSVTRRVCTACHNPHAPGHISLESLPPPQRPRNEDGEPPAEDAEVTE